jgi:uncharacterized protein with GYD domain
MPIYISLINWTDKGVGAFKETVDRAEAGSNWPASSAAA